MSRHHNTAHYDYVTQKEKKTDKIAPKMPKNKIWLKKFAKWRENPSHHMVCVVPVALHIYYRALIKATTTRGLQKLFTPSRPLPISSSDLGWMGGGAPLPHHDMFV